MPEAETVEKCVPEAEAVEKCVPEAKAVEPRQCRRVVEEGGPEAKAVEESVPDAEAVVLLHGWMPLAVTKFVHQIMHEMIFGSPLLSQSFRPNLLHSCQVSLNGRKSPRIYAHVLVDTK